MKEGYDIIVQAKTPKSGKILVKTFTVILDLEILAQKCSKIPKQKK